MNDHLSYLFEAMMVGLLLFFLFWFAVERWRQQ